MDEITLDDVKRILDEQKLKEIALRKDVDHFVRIRAIDQIENEKILKELALSDDEDIIMEAVNLISNQEFLADIALGDAHPCVKCDALRNIEDDDYFDEISGIVDDDFVRQNLDDIKSERAFKRRRIMGLS